MPIPTLTPNGILPAGVHVATLEEVEDAFGSSTPRRHDLFVKFKLFVEHARTFGVFTALYVDGSFVTDKPEPGDIDVALETPLASLVKLLARSDRDKIMDSEAVKAAYEVHSFVEAPPMLIADYFQRLRVEDALARGVPPETRRGIAKVLL